MPETVEPRTFTHRYPWRLEEIAIITTLLVAPTIAFGVVGNWGSTGCIVTTIACGALGGFLIRLGYTRKKTSIVRGVLTGTQIRVDRPNEPKKAASTGDLSNIATVKAIDLNRIDPTLVLEAHPNEHGLSRTAYIPMRLARVMAADLLPHLKKARVTPEAKDLIAAMQAPSESN